MKLKNHTATMKQVMRLIEKHAPNTYDAMQNAYWPVTMIATQADFDEVTREASYFEKASLADDLQHALGITFTPRDPEHTTALSYCSVLNAPALMEQAADDGYSPVKLAATVLVHEWTHRRGYGEPEAYAAGAKFARAMGEERIARSQERTGAKIEQQQESSFEEFLMGLLGEWR
jgi:hypothetical protein